MHVLVFIYTRGAAGAAWANSSAGTATYAYVRARSAAWPCEHVRAIAMEPADAAELQQLEGTLARLAAEKAAAEAKIEALLEKLPSDPNLL